MNRSTYNNIPVWGLITVWAREPGRVRSLAQIWESKVAEKGASTWKRDREKSWTVKFIYLGLGLGLGLLGLGLGLGLGLTDMAGFPRRRDVPLWHGEVHSWILRRNLIDLKKKIIWIARKISEIPLITWYDVTIFQNFGGLCRAPKLFQKCMSLYTGEN